ncbi:unnamed protein product [Lactuca virosa]|uniref:Uncharacterized protein n=1 Tax=Lactuca virosa TaxID=75947 RepID=A0AAU9MY04_9ASTR|nr:unnamed protein product [Lactuca virosa]
MAYNHQSNERPAKSCCEKMHEAIFGRSKRNDVHNPSLSTINDNEPTVKPSPHVSSVPSKVKTSQDLGNSYSNNVEDDGCFNDRVSGSGFGTGFGTGTGTGTNTSTGGSGSGSGSGIGTCTRGSGIGTGIGIGTGSRRLIPRPRVTVG